MNVPVRSHAVRVRPDVLRAVRAGSPWIFADSITSGPEHADAGDLAVIFDDRRRFAAIGLWDPDSPIRVRVLHRGSPRPIDGPFFTERIAAALERRAELIADPDTDAYRCVHGENDGLAGFVLDRYADTAVIKLDTSAWFVHLDELILAIQELLGVQRIVLRLARTVPATVADGTVLMGPPVLGPIGFRERGLRMEAEVRRGSKTGHFLDQRDNRALVRAAADGAEVLDVFANTGGFALSAAAGGARSVHLVDQNAAALETAERNLAANRHQYAVRACRVRTSAADAFDVLTDLRRRGIRHDIVVLDPPSFAPNTRSVPAARRAYARLTRLGVELLRPDGLLVQCSCSSRIDADSFATIVHDAARAAGVMLHETRRTGHPVDHPVGFEHGAYLKAIFARVEPVTRHHR